MSAGAYDVRVLTPDDADEYMALRAEMLVDSPWAFGSSPEDDRASDPARTPLMHPQPFNDIVGGFDLASGSPVLVASSGIYRDMHLKHVHRAHIWGVYVRSSMRGRGIGRAVVERAIAHARSWDGVVAVCLSVSDRAPEALGLYEAMGFVRWGTERDVMRIGGESAGEYHLRLELA